MAPRHCTQVYGGVVWVEGGACVCIGTTLHFPIHTSRGQIDFYRDPMRVHTDSYKQNSQIGEWNNEGVSVNATYKENFIKLKRLIMIKAGVRRAAWSAREGILIMALAMYRERHHGVSQRGGVVGPLR